jgi:hypothetical protein
MPHSFLRASLCVYCKWIASENFPLARLENGVSSELTADERRAFLLRRKLTKVFIILASPWDKYIHFGINAAF